VIVVTIQGFDDNVLRILSGTTPDSLYLSRRHMTPMPMRIEMTGWAEGLVISD